MYPKDTARATGRAGTGPTEEEELLLRRLRSGEQAAFDELVARYQPMMIRHAMRFVPSRAIAEEVVQDTWMGVLRGLERFEGRSSLATWIFVILTRQARERGGRESRSVPVSSLAHPVPERAASWGDPEAHVLNGETRVKVLNAVKELPGMQRTVVALRDIAGRSSAEVRTALEISDVHQRVLLHRGRVKVRRALDAVA